MRRTLRFLTIAAVAAALPDVPRATPASPGDAEPPPAPHVIVGADPDYPPYEFLDRDGQPAGYNVDLTRAIAEVMGMTVEFRFGTWAEIRAGLVSGQIHVLQGISWSEERAKELDFAAPHAIVHHGVFARRDDGLSVRSLDDLRGRRVIVFRGGIMDEVLTQRGVSLVRTGTPADALRRLAAGEADCVAVALLPGIYLTRELRLTNVVPVARDVAAERYGYAVKRGNAELLARFDEGLAILKKTGRYQAIHARWLGVLEPQGVPWRTVARWSAAVLAPLLVILGGTMLWSRSLQKVVAQRTESLAREVAERERAVEELRVHQQQLVQADKMAALGVLVSGVAHEINNPNGLLLLDLPIVKGALLDALEELEARRADGPVPSLAGLPYARVREELPRMLDDMLAAARRIKHTVEDLKDFARREDAPGLEPIDLNEVASAAARLVANSIRKATTRFETDLAAGLPRVRGNARRIEQVVVNLLLNACEALPDPGRALRLTTRIDAGGGRVILEVRDEGVGIAPEHLARITEPFFTTKRARGGTGLGLSVSAGIVKEHGGTLEFDSRPDAGTVATLALPASLEERA
jgi:polar amino acid transport system substrate-binding protein